jgi:hypothetical protein
MRLRCVAGFCLAVLLLAAPSAWADISGTVYRVQGNWLNAANYLPSSTVTFAGTFTAPGINFVTPTPGGSGDLANFLTSGGATYSSMLYTGQVMSNCSSSGPIFTSNCYSTAITITGSQYFLNGASYSLRHDDGVLMQIEGNPFITAAGPVSAQTDSAQFLGVSGVHSYTIYYMATNGNPEVLQSSGVGVPVTTNVPDGGTTALLLGFAVSALGLVSRRLR